MVNLVDFSIATVTLTPIPSIYISLSVIRLKSSQTKTIKLNVLPLQLCSCSVLSTFSDTVYLHDYIHSGLSQQVSTAPWAKAPVGGSFNFPPPPSHRYASAPIGPSSLRRRRPPPTSRCLSPPVSVGCYC